MPRGNANAVVASMIAASVSKYFFMFKVLLLS